MGIAHQAATRSTCPRKHVGAVIVRDRTVLSTGYNGSMRGLPHCEDAGCVMEDGHCVTTVHAEANAILQAAKNGVAVDGAELYTTASPCWNCFKLIANAGIRKHLLRRVLSRRALARDVAKEIGDRAVDLADAGAPPLRSDSRRMLILAADTSLPILSVALVRDDALLGAVALEGRWLAQREAAAGHRLAADRERRSIGARSISSPSRAARARSPACASDWRRCRASPSPSAVRSARCRRMRRSRSASRDASRSSTMPAAASSMFRCSTTAAKSSRRISPRSATERCAGT